MKPVFHPSKSSRPLALALASGLLLALPGASAASASLVRFQAGQEPQSLLTAADRTLEEMSAITGLPIKAPLKKQMISRSEVAKTLREMLHAELTPREIHIQEALLRALGLVPQDFNLEKFLIAFYTEQAAGFYDPRRKTLFIADWPDADTQRMVLTHEITHALQDQSFDLEKFLHGAREDDDATNARQAVVEGQATAAMFQALIQPAPLTSLPSLAPLMQQVVHQQFEQFPEFSSAPFFFRFQALFPYIEGLGFLQRGLARGGWEQLRELFTRPPATTKEIFEPDVYFDHGVLPIVSLPRPAALARIPSLELLDENTLGQMGYYSVLGQLVSEREAKSVALGWLADRYILYEDAARGRYTLVARTRWTTPEKALAFFRDYRQILVGKYRDLTPAPHSTADLFMGSTALGQVILLRKANECLWAEGLPAAPTAAMFEYLKSF